MTEFEYKLPEAISNWIFDLHNATRTSLRSEEVQPLYEVQYKDLTDHFFGQTAWPIEGVVAQECANDSIFLLFYKEMRARHLISKLKPQLPDFIDSWTNYTKVFDFLLSKEGAEIALTAQWVHDIIVEFVYQFQGFCQYRCQIKFRSAEEIEILQANRNVWNLPVVMGILTNLSGKYQLQGSYSKSTLEQFGYFATIERARLECLLGDYRSSLDAVSAIKLGDRSELYMQLPSCHINLYYHTGVSQMMLRNYAGAVTIFGDIALHFSRIMKQNAGLDTSLKKNLDKIVALAAICVSLLPGMRVDEQLKELMDNKSNEKLRRLQLGEISTLTEMFENSCPKFISSTLPEYDTNSNLVHEAFTNQVSVFISEAKKRFHVIKLRSYLRLYASVEIGKLARFSDSTESDLVSQILSFKQKVQIEETDVDFTVKDESLVIDAVSSKVEKGKSAERYFVTGIRKHGDIKSDIKRTVASL